MLKIGDAVKCNYVPYQNLRGRIVKIEKKYTIWPFSGNCYTVLWENGCCDKVWGHEIRRFSNKEN